MTRRMYCAICGELYDRRRSKEKSREENDIMDYYRVCYGCIVDHPELLREKKENDLLLHNIEDLIHTRMGVVVKRLQEEYES